MSNYLLFFTNASNYSKHFFKFYSRYILWKAIHHVRANVANIGMVSYFSIYCRAIYHDVDNGGQAKVHTCLNINWAYFKHGNELYSDTLIWRIGCINSYSCNIFRFWIFDILYFPRNKKFSKINSKLYPLNFLKLKQL